MLRVGFAIYRSWGWEIFKEILDFQKEKPFFEFDTLIFVPEKQFKLRKFKNIQTFEVPGKDTDKIARIIKKRKLDVVLFYSWSWILKPEVYEATFAVALHPSPLPKYRGGTPIQHQLLNGEKTSAVTLFKIGEGIDAGPIIKQKKISFTGDINAIFARMVRVGTELTEEMLKEIAAGKLELKEQRNIEKYPVYKRRKPEESEIKLTEIYDFDYLNNLVRGLLYPYPNAFLNLEEVRINIQKVSFHKNSGKGKIIKKELLVTGNDQLFLKTKEGFARLDKFTTSRN